MRSKILGLALALGAAEDVGLGSVDPYDVLQVPFDATQSEIKKAYRLQSKQSHPDKSNDSGTAFLTLRRAYDVVGNKKLRRKYDQRARSAARAAAAPAFDVLRADTAAPPAGKRHNKRLASDRPLKLGDALVSPDGSHEALFDFDGNFRIVESGSRSVVWETGSAPTKAANSAGFVVLQADGCLVLASGAPGRVEAVLWSSNSADPSAAAAFLSLDDAGLLRVHRRTADNAYALCSWGSAGCGAVSVATTKNSLRVLLRNLFYPSALRSTDAKKSRPGVLSSIFGFLRAVVGLG